MNGSFLRLASALSVLCAFVATAGAMTATAQEAAAPGTLDHATRPKPSRWWSGPSTASATTPTEAADLATQAVGFAERGRRGGRPCPVSRHAGPRPLAPRRRRRRAPGTTSKPSARYRLINDGTGGCAGLARPRHHLQPAGGGTTGRGRPPARRSPLYEEVGDPPGMARAYNSLGHVAREAGAFEEALGLYREELRLAEDVGDEEPVASARHNVGMALHALGRTGEAVAAFEASLAATPPDRVPGGPVEGALQPRLGRTRAGAARSGPPPPPGVARPRRPRSASSTSKCSPHQRLAGVAEAEGRPSEAVRHLQAHATLQDTLARRTLREEVARTAARYRGGRARARDRPAPGRGRRAGAAGGSGSGGC